jgi:pimeloyl-ACP methyl ester carboxylesterase
MDNSKHQRVVWRLLRPLVRFFASAALIGVAIAAGYPDNGYAADAQANGTVYLLLHGLNSDETTWNRVAKRLFGNRCPTLREATDPATLGESRCYRLHFSDTDWPHGDGLSLSQLGAEVDHAVQKIRDSVHPAAIVLVGHSRGGLAARAYLQNPGSTPSFRLALLTLGTPHRGSPFGRIKSFMDENQVGLGDVRQSVRLEYQDIPTPFRIDARDRLEFVFSPSMNIIATDRVTYRNLPCEERKNSELCVLNTGAEQLRGPVSAFGQLLSRGIVLGARTPLREGVVVNLLGNAFLKEFLPQLIPKLRSSDFVRMREYVLAGITGTIPRSGHFCSNARDPGQATWEWSRRNPNSWACNGDGLVPLLSQRLSTLLPQENVTTVRLNGVPHTEETGRIRNLRQLLQATLENHGEFQLP